MGCYGIGVSRLMAAVIEQNHDQAGIVWPGQISPYKVVISALDMTNPVIAAKAGEVYNDLSSRGVEVILDDRQERAGVKFKDAELLGFPLQIIVGKEAAGSGRLELKARGSSEKILAGKEEIYKRVLDS
jgi:prolyl-tRNA synthetase